MMSDKQTIAEKCAEIAATIELVKRAQAKAELAYLITLWGAP